MVGIVIVTHGKFAEGIADSVELIAGPQDGIRHIGLFEGDNMESFKTGIDTAIHSVNSGAGVLVFVDLMGASPFTTVGSLIPKLREAGIELRIVAGCNLPMVLDAAMMQDSVTLDELYRAVMETGKDSIVELRDSMGL